jgi:hypothetical protein
MPILSLEEIDKVIKDMEDTVKKADESFDSMAAQWEALKSEGSHFNGATR